MGSFGERLRDSMVVSGKSVKQLAKQRGVSPQTVRDWCRMKDADLSGKHLVGIAIDLGVACVWLANGIGSPTPIWIEEVRKARFAKETV